MIIIAANFIFFGTVIVPKSKPAAERV